MSGVGQVGKDVPGRIEVDEVVAEPQQVLLNGTPVPDDHDDHVVHGEVPGGDGVQFLGRDRRQDGVLLIDEIDTGLHWTVMEDLWRLVVGAARDGNVQVFATTHSYDCIRGLASLLEREPGLAEEVSLQKLERRLDEAVAFGGERLPRAVAHDIELR